MADDDARVRGARGGRPASARSTMGAAVAAAKKAAKAAPSGPGQEAAGARPATRASTKKVTAAPAPRTAGGKAPARKAPAAKAPAAKVAPARKAPAAKAPAAKAAAGGTARRATAAKAAPRTRLAAEQTFDDDWEPAPAARAPEPVREDPNARIRGILRAAARAVEAREHAGARAPRPDAAQVPAPVTRILIAPDPPAAGPAALAPGTTEMSIDDMDLDEELVEEPAPEEPAPAEEDLVVAEEPPPEDPAPVVVEGVHEAPAVDGDHDESEWAPPEVIEEDAPPAPAGQSSPPAPPPPVSAATLYEPPVPVASPGEKTGAGRPGAGIPVLAILLCVVPLVGAVVGFVLAGRARRKGAPLAGVAQIVAVLALVAWLLGGGVYAYGRIDRGVEYSKLKVGDCFNSSASDQIRKVKVFPCSKSHNSEIFFVVTHPADKKAAYPGKDQLVQFAADACLGQPLTQYLGIPLEQSKLKDFEMVPQESAWKDGGRILVCGIDTGGEGRITGSVKGTRR